MAQTTVAETMGLVSLLVQECDDGRSARVGNQVGGLVFHFLFSDDLWREHAADTAKGVVFLREPSVLRCGTMAVFQAPYGNAWDLIQRTAAQGPA